VRREFDIPEQYVPVMLMCCGYRAEGNMPRKPRLDVDEVLRFDRFSAF
jgi:nitroreductase